MEFAKVEEVGWFPRIVFFCLSRVGFFNSTLKPWGLVAQRHW